VGIGLEIVERSFEIVMHPDKMPRDAEATVAARRRHADDTRDRNLLIRKHDLLARPEALHQVRNRASLFDLERSHPQTIASHAKKGRSCDRAAMVMRGDQRSANL